MLLCQREVEVRKIPLNTSLFFSRLAYKAKTNLKLRGETHQNLQFGFTDPQGIT